MPRDLKSVKIGRRVAAGLAGREFAELADIRPGKLAGRHEVAKFARFELRLLDMVGRLHPGAQDHVAIHLATIGCIRAGGVDVHSFAEPARGQTGSADLVMVTTTFARATQASADVASRVST